jgi:serine/threonine protein kinase
MQPGCPEVATLAEFASGRLPSIDVARLERHLDSCAHCAALLPAGPASERTDASPSPGPNGLLPSGTLLGRYEVRAWIGRGAMGDVYEGFDPQLERKVALKLLRVEIAGAVRARDRLAREAKAMARLSHPHVVAALDFGIHEGRVFLVMELVEGMTLAAWLRRGRRTWREIVTVFLAAGEGLAAAHVLEIVHRDFKPQNTLVGDGGQVRVSDFGLARWATQKEPALHGMHAVAGAGGTPRDTTGTERHAGTPRYMAPEQFMGRLVDARADQFSFCVALYEALSGHHPFDQNTGGTDAGADQAPGPVVASARVPRAISRALARGMNWEPKNRFPSMEPLLRILRRRLIRGTQVRRAILVFTMVGLALAASVVAYLARAKSRPRLLQMHGTAADWSSSRVLTRLPGRVYCLAVPQPGILRVVWGTPRRAEDIDVKSGVRVLSDLVPQSFQDGCPENSPDGQQLIFEGFDGNGRAHIFHSANPSGREAVPVVSSAEPSIGSEPQWLSSGREFVFDLDFWHAAVFSFQSNTTTVIPRPDRDSGPGLFKVVDSRADRILVLYQQPAVTSCVGYLYRWPTLQADQPFYIPSGVGRWRFATGTSIAFGPAADEDGLSFVLAGVDVETTTPFRFARIPGADVGDFISLDEDRAAIVSWTGARELWYIDNAGVERQIVLPHEVYSGVPRMGPDGAVSFLWVLGPMRKVVAYDPQSQRFRDVSAGPDDNTFGYLPSGDLIVGRMGADVGIYRCPRAASCRILREGHAYNLSVSPDGRWIAYVAGTAQGAAVRLLSSDGKVDRDLFTGTTLCEPAWSGEQTLWVSHRHRGVLTWTELDIESRLPTGRRATGQSDCFRAEPDPARPIHGRAWVTIKRESEIRIRPLALK